MVEDDGFRAMIHTLIPGYTLPSRTHFTKLMERKYEQTFNEVKTALNNGNNSKLAFPTDVWTSVAIEAYLGVTCHYITDDWDMKSICLTTMPLQDRHTGSNIAEWLEEVVARFEIPPSNIIAIVHDNGAKCCGCGTHPGGEEWVVLCALHWSYLASCNQCCFKASKH